MLKEISRSLPDEVRDSIQNAVLKDSHPEYEKRKAIFKSLKANCEAVLNGLTQHLEQVDIILNIENRGIRLTVEAIIDKDSKTAQTMNLLPSGESRDLIYMLPDGGFATANVQLSPDGIRTYRERFLKWMDGTADDQEGIESTMPLRSLLEGWEGNLAASIALTKEMSGLALVISTEEKTQQRFSMQLSQMERSPNDRNREYRGIPIYQRFAKDEDGKDTLLYEIAHTKGHAFFIAALEETMTKAVLDYALDDQTNDESGAREIQLGSGTVGKIRVSLLELVVDYLRGFDEKDSPSGIANSDLEKLDDPIEGKIQIQGNVGSLDIFLPYRHLQLTVNYFIANFLGMLGEK